MKRIAKFHKVSWEQFRKDWGDTFGEQPEEKIREFIRRNSLGIADVEELFSMEEVFGAVLSGNAVIFMDGYDRAMKISCKG